MQSTVSQSAVRQLAVLSPTVGSTQSEVGSQAVLQFAGKLAMKAECNGVLPGSAVFQSAVGSFLISSFQAAVLSWAVGSLSQKDYTTMLNSTFANVIYISSCRKMAVRNK